MKYFEDHTVGDKITYPRSYRLNEEEIISVARQWDPQPFHVDLEAAKKSYFKGLIACTTHLFGISSKLPFPDTNDWAIIGALGSNDVKNSAPARPGDTLTLSATCIGKRKSESKPGLGIIEYYVELTNQNNTIVFSFRNSGLHQFRPTD